MNTPEYKGPWLCRAWGETDLPGVRIAHTREDVVEFLCDEWLGEKPDALSPNNKETLDGAMDDFDAAEYGDSLLFEFEIGGVSIERVYVSGEACRAATLAPATGEQTLSMSMFASKADYEAALSATQAAPATGSVLTDEQEREAFEAYEIAENGALHQGGELIHNKYGTYSCSEVQNRWVGWKARAILAAKGETS